MVGVTLTELFEFLSLEEAGFQVLRRHKVLGHLDTVVDVTDLEKLNMKQKCNEQTNV